MLHRGHILLNPFETVVRLRNVFMCMHVVRTVERNERRKNESYNMVLENVKLASHYVGHVLAKLQLNAIELKFISELNVVFVADSQSVVVAVVIVFAD